MTHCFEHGYLVGLAVSGFVCKRGGGYLARVGPTLGLLLHELKYLPVEKLNKPPHRLAAETLSRRTGARMGAKFGLALNHGV